MFFKEESKKARKYAIRYLAYRDRSQHEIICYLKRKKIPTSALNDTLIFLQKNNYINDQHFAIQFGRSRIENKKVGKLRLERELYFKGIEKKIVIEVVNSLYEEFDEMEIAMSCAEKKISSYGSVNCEKKRSRLAMFLKRKGFSSDLIFEVVTNIAQRVSNTDLTSLSDKPNKSSRKSFFLQLGLIRDE